MPRKQPQTVGDEIAHDIQEAFRDLARAPVEGARDLPVVRGVTLHGTFVPSIENVLTEVSGFIADSERVFQHGISVVFEADSPSGNGRYLVPLMTGQSVATGAEDILANLFLCENGEEQFPPPKSLVDVVFRSELFRPKLPRIELYAHKPVFDQSFRLCEPGWDPESRILIHGPHVEPVPFAPPDVAEALDRMPPHLRELLAEFCFASAADLVHAVAFLLTGLLANHFVSTGKPIALIDGNQPGVGKTLFAQLVGILMDGRMPKPVLYTADDDEMSKRLCSTLRDSEQSILLVDNAKAQASAPVSSPAIEASCIAETISLRILGQSENFRRRNDVLWAITMNQTRVSPDLVSRSLPIRLAFEGPPERRRFRGLNPGDYATRHRLDILGELLGMVVRWTEAGRPPGNRTHRLVRWAEVVGGILEVARLPEFLSTTTAVTSAFNPQLDQLAALAEQVASQAPGQFWREFNAQETPSSLAASAAWEPIFRQARLLTEELSRSRSRQAHAVAIGQFLSPLIGRDVSIVVGGRSGRATLQSVVARARTRLYGFIVTWEDASPDANPPDRPTRPAVASASPNTPVWAGAHRSDPASAQLSGNGAARGNNEVW